MDTQAEAPQESFREAKARELRERREGREAEDKAIDAELKEQFALQPADDDASEDVVEDGQLEDNASEVEVDEESEPEEPAEDEEAYEDADEDLAAKFERVERERSELEKKLSQVTANRKQIEEGFANSQKRFIEMRHEMDDSLTEIKRGAEFYAGLATQELQQLQQVNPAQLPPEQQSQYYQQLNQATQRAQQLQAMYQQASERERAERELQRKREAEVAVAVIKSRIPEWSNEHYATLGEIAGEYGYSQKDFSEITDPRMIQLLHKDWQSRQASRAVEKTVKQRKAKAPRSRSGVTPQRNAKGQFEKAKKDFKPNQRGTFAQMKAIELALRRERRK
jgi:hypothetical protein